MTCQLRFPEGAQPNRTCRSGPGSQNGRCRGKSPHAYALHAGRIFPSHALPPTPRLSAAWRRCRGLPRVFFHHAAQGR
jgi:hypothetical protein